MKPKHPLICSKCGNYYHIDFFRKRYDNVQKTNKAHITIPIYVCKSCGNHESIIDENYYIKYTESLFQQINEPIQRDIPLHFIIPKLNESKKFEAYKHLGFSYNTLDHYLIPGLYREWDDGYLTPVFFNKDVLLYYNTHPDYSVRLSSFSSGNIYHNGEPLFKWGFGINRQGLIFKWLGDLNEDFKDESMQPHLKRFQASNVESDHDIYSKFYLSQIPMSPEDAFQDSDNESMIFRHLSTFSNIFLKKHSTEIYKVDIEHITDYYRPPILNDREQVFSAFLSLHKALVENLQEEGIRSALLEAGVEPKNLLNNKGEKLRSLKLFEVLIDRIIGNKEEAKAFCSPFFVLNDLRQLHGHLSNTSFDEKVKSCIERLELPASSSYLDIYEGLIKALVGRFEFLSRWE